MFEKVSDRFKPQHDKMILSFQYHRLRRQQSENAKECIGHLRIKANECAYEGKDRTLNEQFINGINDDGMMTEIVRELTTRKMTSEITSELVLCSARTVETQRAQITILDVTRESKELDAVKT